MYYKIKKILLLIRFNPFAPHSERTLFLGPVCSTTRHHNRSSLLERGPDVSRGILPHRWWCSASKKFVWNKHKHLQQAELEQSWGLRPESSFICKAHIVSGLDRETMRRLLRTSKILGPYLFVEISWHNGFYEQEGCFPGETTRMIGNQRAPRDTGVINRNHYRYFTSRRRLRGAIFEHLENNVMEDGRTV